jgi:Coenzyme PQQ synthesis protein D (PqqD)
MSIDSTELRTSPDARITVPQHVVFRSFVKETVVLNLDTGRYHGLNPTGGRMLEVLRDVAIVKDAAEQLAREYGVPYDEIERDLIEFCDDLATRGLIERDGAAG